MKPNERQAAESRDVSRRAFIAAGAAAGALAVVGRPRGALTADSRPPTAAFQSAFELDELTIAQLQEGMASGRWTARRLAELYLARIDALDRKGPAIRQVIELNPDALAIADGLDAERRGGRTRGPLHGIPILLKDNIATADRMETTAGSLALVGSKVPRDAHIVTRLREAGAVILGKTNLSEWANFRSTHSSSGWSARGGQTRNPYALDRTPSGSSSGSGGAIAANFAAVAVGTETDGSVTSPAAAMSLVGIKPTIGLVSRAGIIPIAHTQDTAGPMTRTVEDAAILLTAMAGADTRDPVTAAGARRAVDFTRFLDRDGLRGTRIGVAREKFAGYNDRTDRVLGEALEVMRGAGATIVDPANIATARTLDADEYDLLMYEFKADLNAYLGELTGSRVRTLADVIAFNRENAAIEMPYFGQEIMERSQRKGSLRSAEYRRMLARGKRRAGAEGIDATMKRHRLDAIVAPTQGPPTLIDLVNGDPSGGGYFTSPAAIAGYPHITVPMGFVFGLPLGISFVGGAWSEPALFRLAYAFEQATKHRRPPTFAPTANLSV